MNLKTALNSAELLLVKIGNALQSPLLLILRLYWGWSFAQTGWGKLTHLDRTAGFFASLDLPWSKLNAILAGGTECIGGLLLLLGLGSRLVAVPLAFTMVVAYGTAHHEEVRMILSEPDKFTEAPPFLFLLVVLLVLTFGPGKFSLDAWLRPASQKK